MKDLKFRAWFKDWDGEFRMSFSDRYEEDEIPTSAHILMSYFFRNLSPDAVIMLCTGLKDKNGKDIFEGDVIEYKSYSVFKRWWSDTKEIPVIEAECEAQRQDVQIVRNSVEFRDGGFMLGYHLTMRDVSRGQKFKTGQSSHGDTESKEWDFEVIGNIWQHPELLNHDS